VGLVRGKRPGTLGARTRGERAAGGSAAGQTAREPGKCGAAGQARPAGSSTNTGISREVFSWYSA
jgi:hypothetical protein